MKLLEEFWYGNIEPTEYDTSSKEYKKLQELICRNEEKLRAVMTDEQKELFEKYTDCVREYQTITDCLIFQSSFKLGARMILWSKRCKDEALRGTVKETITQVSRSKKKYQELKKKAQPYLDALEIASERVRAFLDVVLSRGKETQEHKQSVHRRGHDMEH